MAAGFEIKKVVDTKPSANKDNNNFVVVNKKGKFRSNDPKRYLKLALENMRNLRLNQLRTETTSEVTPELKRTATTARGYTFTFTVTDNKLNSTIHEDDEDSDSEEEFDSEDEEESSDEEDDLVVDHLEHETSEIKIGSEPGKDNNEYIPTVIFEFHMDDKVSEAEKSVDEANKDCSIKKL